MRSIFQMATFTTLASLIAMSISASPAHGDDTAQIRASLTPSERLAYDFDKKHEACLETIGQDAESAYEEAMIWRSTGGGRRARHCEAMALFALGHQEEAAYRLDNLAKAPDGGTHEMRVNHYSEAANFWLISNQADEAYASATAGLELSENHIDLRITRARAYALMGRYDHAEADLTSVLHQDRDHANALRYRADARRHQDKLYLARADIERSLSLDPTSVDTAVVRGEINEAIRLSQLSSE